jgi:aminopeptidase N
MRTDTGGVVRLEDYRPSDYLIPETRLVFRLGSPTTQVTATLSVRRRDPQAEPAPLRLDGETLELSGISLDGRPLAPADYTLDPEGLTLLRPPRAAEFTLDIETIVSPDANTGLMGLYRSSGVFCTQCEAEGFRRITYFLDRPDILSVYTVRLEADRTLAPALLSNGNPAEAGDLGEGRHFAIWHDPFPKPSYLFALVAGDLALVSDTFTTRSGRLVDLGIHVEHGKEGLTAYAMDALKRSMRWDEDAFGREYDLSVFNIVAVSDFNMGAMENKGLNIFNDKYVLADEDTATDTDFANIEAIIAHEYFHNWTGNRITCRDWFQLCLKEGLTVFRDHEFSADMRSRAVKRIAEVRALRAHQFPEDQGPLAHPVRPRRYREINNFYTATVYEKGAEVVRMIRTILGHEDFRRGMDIYFDRHDGEAATVEDFLRAFEEASGQDLSQFALWYHQAGTPNVSARVDWDEATGTLTLDAEQAVRPTPGESRKKLMHIPLAFGLVGPSGEDMRPTSIDGAAADGGVLHLRKRSHRVRFHGLAERPVLSLNRGFSAPVTLSLAQRPDDLSFLARHDSDPFSRWQAFNTMLVETLVAAARGLTGGVAAHFPAEIADLAGALAVDDRLEPAFRAQALSLPGESDIARELGSNIDPEAVLAARNSLCAGIAAANTDACERIHLELADHDAYSPDAASAGRRALRNVVLDYLATRADGAEIAARHFHAATNMTDRAAALTVLAHRHGGSAQTHDALAQFEARHAGSPLVLDKWLAIQAAAPGDGALETMRKLMTHRAFSASNPNRVRALFGTFFSGNQTGFHRLDGAGYALFVETILETDRQNPQVAARLATGLRSWRSLEPLRRERARQALVEIAGAPGLSADVADIVERTLA